MWGLTYSGDNTILFIPDMITLVSDHKKSNIPLKWLYLRIFFSTISYQPHNFITEDSSLQRMASEDIPELVLILVRTGITSEEDSDPDSLFSSSAS